MPTRVFRIILEVGDPDRATAFYSRLLGTAAPIPEYVYFAVDEIEALHARAKALDALSKEKVHGESAAEIVVRPWGERSFYAFDPWGNGLCFVDDKTLFTGRR